MKRDPASLNIKRSLKRKKETQICHTQSENNQHRLETTKQKRKRKRKQSTKEPTAIQDLGIEI